MSILGDIQTRFYAYIKEIGVEATAKEFGVYPSIAQRWVKGTHLPHIDKLSQYYEKNLNESIAKASRIAPPEWDGRNLMILFPAYKDTNPATAWVLAATALDLGKEFLRLDMEQGNSMIYTARNLLAHRFLESGCEWSLWLDDDMIPPIGRPDWIRTIGSLPPEYPTKSAGMHWVHRLMSHKKTVVGGTYFGRFAEGPPMHGGMNNEDAHMASKRMEDKIIPIDWIATGCLLVHRQVYLDIQKSHPFLAPGKKDMPTVNEMTGEMMKVPIEFKHWQYFWPRIGLGEDVSFCKRALETGHQPFLDVGLQALHVGRRCYHALNTNAIKKR